MISASRLSPPKPLAAFRAPTRAACRIRCSVAAATPPARAAGSMLYEVLGLRAGATGLEIKAAYRRLARERHPDVAGPPAAGEFIRIHEAYATLSDPAKRARYDREVMARWPPPPPPRAAWRWPARYPRRRTWETDQCW